MGRYTLEPPRRNLIRHHTFDDEDTDAQRLIDLSPQNKDSVIRNGRTERIAGKIGVGSRLVDVNGELGTVGNKDVFTVSVWVKPQAYSDTQPILQSDNSTFIALREDKQINFLVPGVDTSDFLSGKKLPDDDWTLVTLVYDGTNRKIYFNDDLVAEDTAGGGTATLGDVSISPQDLALDDFRFYRTELPLDQIDDLYTIGAEQTFVKSVRKHWNNPGLPLYEGENNQRLGSSLAEYKRDTQRQIDAILESRHINFASGKQLDRIGELASVRRRDGEPDANFRARIIGTAASGRSRGTFDDLIQTAAVIFETTVDNITIVPSWKESDEPATAIIYVDSPIVDDAKLQNADISQILKNTVLAGHDIEVRVVYEPAFIITSDNMTVSSDNGLTSDSLSTGGKVEGSL